MEIRHILAPTDFSEHATQAVTTAFELAQTFGAKLTVLHVVVRETISSWGIIAWGHSQHTQADEEGSHQTEPRMS